MSEALTSVQIQFDLSPFGEGLPTIPLNVPEIVDGKTADQFPRNEIERNAIDQILMRIQGGTVISEEMQEKLKQTEALITRRENIDSRSCRNNVKRKSS